MIGMMRPFYQAHWDISKDIKHVWLLICTYYIAWIFQWILSGEGRGKWWDRQYRVWIPQCAAPLDVTVTYARDSFVDSPSVLRPGWHMQETAFVDSQGGLLSSRGGAQTHWHRHIGTSLTSIIMFAWAEGSGQKFSWSGIQKTALHRALIQKCTQWMLTVESKRWIQYILCD